MKKISLLFVLLCVSSFSVSAQSLKTVWATKAVLQVPESVFYNQSTHEIYVSNINGKPSAKDHNGFISKLDKNGNIIQLQWVKGLNAPKGMAVKGSFLYVSDINRLAKINLKRGTVVRFFRSESAKFLNDVVVGPAGNIYATDSQLGAIYILKDNQLRLWKMTEILKGANGLAVGNGHLLVGVKGHLLSINPLTMRLKILIDNAGGIDGLIPLGKGKYVVSDWAGKIQIISTNHTPVVLSNTTAQKINAADLGFIPGENIILIPTFYNNRVIAKKLIDY